MSQYISNEIIDKLFTDEDSWGGYLAEMVKKPTREELAKFRRIVNQLCEEDKSLYNCMVLKQMTSESAAEKLNLSPSTVRHLYSRLIKKLKHFANLPIINEFHVYEFLLQAKGEKVAETVRSYFKTKNKSQTARELNVDVRTVRRRLEGLEEFFEKNNMHEPAVYIHYITVHADEIQYNPKETMRKRK